MIIIIIIVVIIKSTPCNHFQEYSTCVLSCYLQEPFTWLQESKRADRSTTKMSLSTSRLKMLSNYSNLWKKTQVMNTAHSAISYFITGLSPTCMLACAWENTLIKVFVGSNDQQWRQTMTFCLGVVKHAWLTKVGFAVCLVRSTICVHGTVKVVSLRAVKAASTLCFLDCKWIIIVILPHISHKPMAVWTWGLLLL